MVVTQQQNRKRQHAGRNNWEFRKGRSRRPFRSEAKDPSPLIAPARPTCSVCNLVENPKYKCPKCRQTYCSVQCCRNHKEHGCKTQSETLKASSSSVVPVAGSKYLPKEELLLVAERSCAQNLASRREGSEICEDLEDGWKITNSMLLAMEKSKWLKTELEDAGLQQIIRKIDLSSAITRKFKSTTKKDETLDQAKIDYPRFKIFIDKLLVLVGVLERYGKDNDLDLDEWLEKEELDDSAQLILKPLDRPVRVRPPTEEIMDDESSSNSDSSSEEDDDTSSSTSSGSNSSGGST
jgi:hypothetical protein